MKNNTLFAIVSAVTGLIFGFGLLVSGMANPAKVIGFLDLSVPWDPSLMFVMGGAIAIGLPGFLVAKRLKHSLLGMPMNLPTGTEIDRKLLLGAVMFGAGWGIGGFCPGPAVVAAASGMTDGLVFAASMLVGMFAFSARGQQ
ncbi:YeeE/YedE family protein [Limnobacter parvus]|uniref:YeeE/YedE family protein n=1 Tax=Limnobacter parvus TaxID=2939690 RepID=A0ABT1XML5_9BURK|nr:YeeE/YedE family protein [Limnobacter parvus]MCR2747334.1 YeeE/YedE family protein [Limnobacter parvus]